MADLNATAIDVLARLAVGGPNQPGFCLAWVDSIILGGVQSNPPRPAGGFQYAIQGWQYAADKHPGDRLPPAGVPVYFGVSPTRTDRNKAAGDVTISLGGGLLAATDSPYSGRIGITTISARADQTQRPYEGWAGDFLGHTIAYTGAHTTSTASTGTTTVIKPATTSGDTPVIKNLYHLVTSKGQQSYLAESDFVIWSVNSSDYAAYKKAYKIKPVQINEFDYDAVNRGLQRNNAEMARLVRTAS